MAESIIPEVIAPSANQDSGAAAPAQKRVRKGRAKRSGSPQRRYNVSDADLSAIYSRLSSVALNLVAIHNTVLDATEDDGEWLLQLIKEAARSSVRAIDASLSKISGAPALGNFADDLANE